MYCIDHPPQAQPSARKKKQIRHCVKRREKKQKLQNDTIALFGEYFICYYFQLTHAIF